MHADLLALLLLLAAGMVFWLAWSGNYWAVGRALGLPMTAPASSSQSKAA